jgi:hypothetical protein
MRDSREAGLLLCVRLALGALLALAPRLHASRKEASLVKIILTTGSAQQYKLDLPGATRDDCDLVCLWLAHLITPHLARGDGRVPFTLTLEIW